MADNNTKVGVELTADTKSLRSQLREATMELVKLQSTAGASADEIAKVAKRAGQLKDAIGDARDTIDAFNPDQKFKAFSQSIQGVAGAFSASQGAMALFGSESENLQKQLLKVQGALALSEGLNTIIGSIDGFKNLGLVVKDGVVGAFKSLKTAIGATGIGLLVLAMGALIANFDDIKKVITKLFPTLEKLGDYFGGLIEKVTDFVGITSETDRALEKFAKNSKLRKEQYERELSLLQAQGATEKELSNIRKKIIMEDLNVLEAKRRNNVKLSEEEQKTAKDLRFQLITIDAEYNSKMSEQQKKALDELAKQREEADQKWIEQEQKRIDRLEALSKAGKTEFEIKMGELQDQYNLDLEMFKDSEGAKLMAKKWYDDQAMKAMKEEKERIRESNKDDVEKYLKDLEKRGEKEAKAREKTQNMIIKSMDKSIAKTQDQTKVDNLNRQIRIQNADAIGNALGALSGMAEQGSDLQKGLALGQVAVDTAIAISSLTANSEANPANAVTFGGAGVSQFATGIIRILANIAQAKSILSQAPGNGGSIATPSISTSAPVMPQYQAPQATRLDQQSLNTISNVVARAYVVESDITGSQKRIKRIETASKF